MCLRWGSFYLLKRTICHSVRKACFKYLIISYLYKILCVIGDKNMKTRLLFITSVALLVFAGCKNTNNQTNTDMNNNEPLKEVAGRKNFGAAHALMTTPQPCVMIATWDKDHTPDVMMAAWAGQYDHNQIVVSMSKHKTTENLELTGAFTVSFADERTVAESDYLGLVSGKQVPDKVAKVGFTVTPSPNVDAPIINEYPFTLECKVVSWEGGILVGEVVNMSADESILTGGKVDLAKLKPIVFDAAAMSYRSVGEEVGKAWGAGKKFTE